MSKNLPGSAGEKKNIAGRGNHMGKGNAHWPRAGFLRAEAGAVRGAQYGRVQDPSRDAGGARW